VIPPLHIVTNDAVLQQSDFVSIATELLLVVQRRMALHIRSHGISAARLVEIVNELQPRAQMVGSWLIVNDRADVALVTGATGVHVGARSLPIAVVRALKVDLRIGYSAHTPEEAAEADHAGADFIFAGSIYPTASHPGVAPGGLPLLEATVAHCNNPVLAIGGVTHERVGEVMRTGAYGVAVIGAVWRAPDPVQAAEHFARLLEA
jgi:thiamine-phosphate diphosphorylase